MIISASRRTDIPAFYAEWMLKRIRAGYCTVPNPFNRQQVTRVDLSPEAVDCFVFWTRNPRPLCAYLDEIDQYGYHYYFQYTILGNPRQIDPHAPMLEDSLQTARALAKRVGAGRVVWRYDPIVLSNITDVDYHIQTYRQIARALRGYTTRSIISVMDRYAKIEARLGKLELDGIRLMNNEHVNSELTKLIPTMVEIAAENGIEIQSCAEELDLGTFGVHAGKCIDDDLILREFSIQVSSLKDATQRKSCGCIQSKDIGMYDTCLFGCMYCYATGKFSTAQKHHAQHQVDSPSLTGWYE